MISSINNPVKGAVVPKTEKHGDRSVNAASSEMKPRQTHRRMKLNQVNIWNEAAAVWPTDFSWVAGDGNSISKTSWRLWKTLESRFLPANHRQLLHTLITHHANEQRLPPNCHLPSTSSIHVHVFLMSDFNRYGCRFHVFTESATDLQNNYNKFSSQN